MKMYWYGCCMSSSPVWCRKDTWILTQASCCMNCQRHDSNDYSGLYSSTDGPWCFSLYASSSLQHRLQLTIITAWHCSDCWDWMSSVRLVLFFFITGQNVCLKNHLRAVTLSSCKWRLNHKKKEKKGSLLNSKSPLLCPLSFRPKWI